MEMYGDEFLESSIIDTSDYYRTNELNVVINIDNRARHEQNTSTPHAGFPAP